MIKITLIIPQVLINGLRFTKKAYQLLTQGQQFSMDSSTNRTGYHDIIEIMLKVVLNTIQSINIHCVLYCTCHFHRNDHAYYTYKCIGTCSNSEDTYTCIY